MSRYPTGGRRQSVMGLQGTALMDAIGGRQAALPRRTLIGMAMGGLRVRMMRSMVTLISVILAIAFLCYMGMSNKLVNVLANKTQVPGLAAEQIESLQRASAVLAGHDFVGAMSEAQKDQIVVLLSVPPPESAAVWHDFSTHLNKKQKRYLGKVASRSGATVGGDWSAADQNAYARELRALVEDQPYLWQDTVDQMSAAHRATIVKAMDTRAGDDGIALAMKKLFNEQVGQPTGLSDSQLLGLAMLVQIAAGHEQIGHVKTMLDHERVRREGAEIEDLLRENRINAVEMLNEGNPIDNWLILMALLTCAVGIANAMLMSVTERIREIGTMKCLGAIDSLVVKLFLIESGLMGLFGSAFGLVLGILVALLGGRLQFDHYGAQYFPWVAGSEVIGWSVLAGLVLAVSGAVGPAIMAARMRPVDALRVDE